MSQLAPEAALEALLQKREQVATRQILRYLTNIALDKIGDHAFVVRRWHVFSRKVEAFLKGLDDAGATNLLGEFYFLCGEIDAGADLPPPEIPKPVIIRHVKWEVLSRCGVDSDNVSITPLSLTNQFKKLPALPRGTLIFIPEEEDYEAEQDEFSREGASGHKSGLDQGH